MTLRKVILCLVFLFAAAAVYATATINGTTGTVTMPTTGTLGARNITVGFHYITGYPTMAVLFGGGILEDLDLTGAVEVDEDSPIDPFIHIGMKYRYIEGTLNSAIGGDVQNSDAPQDETRFSIYNVIGKAALSGEFSLGIGYTFDNESNINFWMGYSTPIFEKWLYFETDFSNFPYRYYWWPWEFANAWRGMVNMAVRLKIGSLFVADIGSLDLMDDNREFYLGGKFKFSL